MQRNLPTEEEVEAEANSGTSFTGRLFKIARCEQIHFICLAIMFSLISYIYAISRDMKDAIVIERLDPASIPYLKMLVVLPINIIIIFSVQKILSNSSIGKIYPKIFFIFFIYFIFYGLILLKFRDLIELNIYLTRDWYSDSKMNYIGLQWTSAIALTINSWTSSLMYLIAEIWSTLVLQFLFFCYANEICTLRQSLRYTPLFLFFSNVSLISSGFSLKGINYVLENASFNVSNWLRQSIFIFLGGLCFILYFLVKYFEDSVRNKPLFIVLSPIRNSTTITKTRTKVGITDGIDVLTTSKLVLVISFVVIAYAICVNIVEASFKSCMNQYAINKGLIVSNHVMATQSDIQLCVGLFAMVLLLTPFPSLIRTHGFSYIAYASPFFCFFGIFLIFGLTFYNVNFNNNFLHIEQLFGVMIVTGFKLLKYSAFDISKEALSMKINSNYRARFKGIYDGICNKFGKALGSGIISIQNLVYDTTDVREACVSSLGIATVLTVIWCLAVKYLSNKYEKSVDNNSDIDIDLFKGKSLL